jgi:hypothetical protein
MVMVNTLAYYDMAKITAVKYFIALVPVLLQECGLFNINF